MTNTIIPRHNRRRFLKVNLISLLSFHFSINNAVMINPKGIVIRASKYPVDDTINRLVVFLQENGATIYARINQQTELHNAGLHIPPLQFVLFGNPQVGGIIMSENPVAALDLPLKIIAWEDRHKKVWIAYNDALFLARRYALSPMLSSSLNLDKMVSAALKIQMPSGTDD